MKTLTFELSLRFDKNIEKLEHIEDVMCNILEALKRQRDELTLAPGTSSAVTEWVFLKSKDFNIVLGEGDENYWVPEWM